MEDDAEERTRRRREAMSLRVFELGQEPADDYRDWDPGARIALAIELSARAWALTGRPVPDYERAAIPGRLVRLP